MATIMIKGYEVLIDDEDVHLLSQFNWHLQDKNRGGFYLRTKIPAKTGKWIYLHRFIMRPIDSGLCVDHINGNVLDNRKTNLRVCTRSQNQMNQRLRKDNTSGEKGVHFYKRSKKWKATIQHENKQNHLGTFLTKEAAMEAYSEAAKKYHGEFARLK